MKIIKILSDFGYSFDIMCAVGDLLFVLGCPDSK